MTLDLAALLACALITSALSLRAPVLRPHAVSAITCAALYLARTVGGPRVAVAVFAVWPAVAVWLLRRAAQGGRADVGILGRVRFQHGLDLGHVAAGERAATDEDHPLIEERHITQLHAAILAPFALYAAALAYGGHYLRAAWPWPLLAPNALPLLCALAAWRRPRTWAERAALVLPASCAGDLVSTWAGAPEVARVTCAVATWAAFAGACAMARRELRGSQAQT